MFYVCFCCNCGPELVSPMDLKLWFVFSNLLTPCMLLLFVWLMDLNAVYCFDAFVVCVPGADSVSLC
jgi:hypothetical protein